MSTAIKGKQAYSGPIDAHGILAGNTLPLKWMDNGGSIRRRMIVIAFLFAVDKVRTDLLGRLKTEEFPFILRKINWCYRQAVVLLRGRDVWRSGLLSQHILEQNQAMFTSMNSLRMFLRDSTIQRREGLWCPSHVFEKAYNDFCQSKHLKQDAFNEDLYTGPLRDYGCSVRRCEYVWGGVLENRTRGNVVMGACMQADTALIQCEGLEGENPVYLEETDSTANIYTVLTTPDATDTVDTEE